MTFEFDGRTQGNRIVTGVIELTRLGYWPLAALIFFASVLVALVATIYPARQASRLEAVEAIRHE